MQFVFLDMANQTLFTRDDAERAEWSLEEKTINLDFPFLSDKVISTGQRVYFKDPSTSEPQIYEIKTAKTLQPDAYQQVTAEHICISELTDCHMDAQEVTDTTCRTALNGVLSGTQWQVGNVSVNPVGTVDLPRGSVWQAVLDIQNNYNVYIVPRLTFSGGTIGRYLDITSTAGEWNGIRLSIDKNFLDPSVTYDDTELATALFGYGGTINGTTATEPDREVDFSEVVWTATADHPAKPYGQKYIEDPAATRAYGRNGRARYGYYQNSDIEDPETLLQKTWEALKNVSTPAISIEGTVADLYRMGYADQPIRLHDIALVEVLPAGFKKELQIIRATVDLLDPSETVVTIGAYIPNIIYIDRDTNENATGVRGGGRNTNKTTTSWQEFRTQVTYLENGTGLRFQAVQNDINHQEEEIAIQSGRIDVAYNRIDVEVTDRREADNQLTGRITVQANRINLVVEGTGSNAKIRAARIVAAINSDGTSETIIDADKVRITGNTTINDVFTFSGGGLNALKTIYVGDSGNQLIRLGADNGAVNGQRFILPSDGAIEFRGATTLNLDNTTLAGMVKSFEVNGGILTLTPFVGDPVNFNKAVSLSGTWNGATYTVEATSGTISGTIPSTTVVVAVEVGGTSVSPNTKINAKAYHDNPSVPANQIGVVEMTLSEDVTNKKVKLTTENGSITKGEISTAATYNAGWNYGQTQITRTARDATSQEITIKTLDFGERWTIVDTYTKPGGSTSQIVYTVAAKANPYPTSKTLRCTSAAFSQSQWVYTFTYTSSTSGMFTSGRNYKFHHNSGYT
jgi:phage minor structural protein